MKMKILVLSLILISSLISIYKFTNEKDQETESTDYSILEEYEELFENEENAEELKEELPQETKPQIVDNLDFGVGYGILWSDGIFAPFADMGAWVEIEKYSNNGAINLGQISKETGIKYFNLGFINAVDSSVDENGVLNWGFGAYEVLSEKHANTNEQYQGIKKAISDVRLNGGDVVISIGGLNERNFFQYTNDLDVLVNTYVEIIDGFNLTRLDLDIEGSAQGYETNKLNAEAIKIAQEKTGVEIILTLPVLPSGLTTDLGVPTLQAYLDCGVDIEAVNIMAMCYGSYFGDYAIGTTQAIDSTMMQIKECYELNNISLSDEDAYNKIGITTSVGFEGEAHPVFTKENSKTSVDYAYLRNINFVSFWSINRDSQTQDNKGIYDMYEHTDIYLDFENDLIEIKESDFEKEEIDVPKDIEYTIWSREDEALGVHIVGVYVVHNGALYKQVSDSTSWWCEPGTNEEIWQKKSITN